MSWNLNPRPSGNKISGITRTTMKMNIPTKKRSRKTNLSQTNLSLRLSLRNRISPTSLSPISPSPTSQISPISRSLTSQSLTSLISRTSRSLTSRISQVDRSQTSLRGQINRISRTGRNQISPMTQINHDWFKLPLKNIYSNPYPTQSINSTYHSSISTIFHPLISPYSESLPPYV